MFEALLIASFVGGGTDPIDVGPGELAHAIEVAAPGQVLRLQPGLYRGPITISKAISLVGMPGAILEGSGSATVL
ncbi:MAG: hypothetical protein R3C68_04695, partial [Myxococcota bacterium]